MSMPSEPRKLSAESTTETVAELRWLEPEDTGGGMIVGYQIDRKLEGILTGFSDIFGGSGYKVAPSVSIITPSDGTLARPFSGTITGGEDFEIGDEIILPSPDLNVTNRIQATAQVATAPDDVITSLTTLGGNITGYIDGESITLSGGSGNGATATADIVGGEIQSVTLVFGGSGYTVGDELTITGDDSDKNTATIEVGTIADGVIQTITITNPGNGYSGTTVISTSIDSDMGVNGVIEFDLVQDVRGVGATAKTTLGEFGEVVTINVTEQGSGYSSPPSILIQTSGGIQAEAVANLDGDKVDSVTIINGGTGYTFTPMVDILAPIVGDKAEGEAVISTETAIVTGISVDLQGNGYDNINPPIVEIARPPFNGKIIDPFQGTITNPGMDYEIGDQIILPPPDLNIENPIQATAEVLDVNTGSMNEITEVKVTNPGNGYSGTNVTSTSIDSNMGTLGEVEFELIAGIAATANAVVSDDMFQTLVDDTESTETAFSDTSLFPRNTPTYQVAAINDQ